MTEDIIGKIIEGEVTNVTNFGAFVKIPELKEEGLVHISEIADQFVEDINKFVKIGETVKVKVLKRTPKNKLELSIKQAKDSSVEAQPSEKKPPAPKFQSKPSKPAVERNPKNKFEEKLSHFMKRSEEKLIDIRRNLKQKQGITKKRK
ncbi:S1 RNA-binding domain-containing protein [Candidatus Margulisiibacteriota bacterium]